MFGLRPFEIVIILVVALLIFGPKSLPALGRALGRGLREFKDAGSKFTEALDDAAKDEPAARKSPERPSQPREIAADPMPQVVAPAGSVSTSVRNE